MAVRNSRRVVLLALLAALALGLALAWWAARVWTAEPTPESRARETAQQIRDRVHELTH